LCEKRGLKMITEKRALMCVFRPGKLKGTQEMREWYASSYPRFLEMESVEFKCWWCDQEKQEWGAFYVFKTEEALKEYIASDIWQKVVLDNRRSWTYPFEKDHHHQRKFVGE
jgi:hypothetical protein